MVETIRKDGDIKYPLSARNVHDDGTYVVEVGCQRLKALETIGATEAPCIVHCLEGQAHIPDGKIIEGDQALLDYFGGRVKRQVITKNSLQVVPLDVDSWDPHRAL